MGKLVQLARWKKCNLIQEKKGQNGWRNSRSSDGNCPCTFLKPTITKPVVEQRRSRSRAGLGAGASQNGDGDERGAEEEIQQDTKNGEECDSSEKADQQHRKGCVNHRGTGHAFHRLHPCWNRVVMMLKV